MNIVDLLKDPKKAKELLNEAIINHNWKLARILIPIVKDPELTYKYADWISKKKVKDEWEDIIAKDAQYSFNYARYVLHGPFPKGEDTIAQDAFYSCSYAAEVLKGPFPKGEDTIARDAKNSYFYAKDALHDRFIKGEKTIINSAYLGYYINFLKEIGKLDEFLKDHPEVKL
jgi:lambda repressor-like predicted transcriptional regulator